jgi:hypothetical protein
MIERLFDLVKGKPISRIADRTEVRPPHGSKITHGLTKQSAGVRRLHGHMKRTTSSLVGATLRTGFLVGLALILILVILPAAVAAQAAGLR